MRLPGLIQIDEDFNKENLPKLKVLNITFTDPHASSTLSNVGLIPEIKYNETLFYKVLEDLDLQENDMVALTSASLKELIFNLSILSAINHKNVEFINGTMYYTGPLRRNIHLRDEDFELNLEDYDLEELDDLDD
jgi:hypothetical protein